MRPPWMPLHVGDYLSDTGHLTTAQHGAYLLLIMHYWRTGSLPGDARQLASIARMPLRSWQHMEPIIKAFFQDDWKHKRVEHELSCARQKYEARANAGRRGGIEKAKKNFSNATDLPQQCSANLDPTTEILESKGRKKENVRACALRPDWPSDYREQFWSQYPHKVGKPKAISKLDQLARSRDGPQFTDLMSGLHRYAAKTDDRPWLNPATFLNQARWADQPANGNYNGHKQHPAQHAFDLADQLEGTLEREIDRTGNATRSGPIAIGVLK